jgi:hypothetical protein
MNPMNVLSAFLWDRLGQQNMFSESRVGRLLPRVACLAIGHLARVPNSEMLVPSQSSPEVMDHLYFGLISVEVERYSKKVSDSRSGLLIKPGERCVTLHIRERILGETGLAAAKGSLGMIARELERMDPEQRPQHVIGATYDRLARAACWAFKFKHLRPRQSVFSARYIADFYAGVDEMREKGFNTGDTSAIELANMPSAEFIERFRDARLPNFSPAEELIERADRAWVAAGNHLAIA